MNGLNLNIGTSASGKDAQAHGIVAQGADVTINNAGNIPLKQVQLVKVVLLPQSMQMVTML